MVRLSGERLDGEALRRELDDAGCGAVVVFEGVVRSHQNGAGVVRLDYEAAEALAVAEGQAIEAEARRRFGVDHVLCVHRVGSLRPGEVAVWLGVASSHRSEAFEACRFVLEEVKRRLPIWKKEHYTSGTSSWLNEPKRDAPSAN